MQDIICVTGRMASGKNYFCKKMEDKGYRSIDADILVHKAIEAAAPQIISAFGKKAEQAGICITNGDGSINRKTLGALLFTSPQLLKLQEEIVYPIVIRMTEDFILQNPEADIIINATVLYKTPELMNKCSKIIFIKACFFKRLMRAKKRDGLPLPQIIRRFKAQRSLLLEYKKTGIPIELVRN